ncbi:MAG: hypothetical protein H7Z42_09660, partial [Roseiflexaceae bacterium]|nr:hypothetical protein [Roseiflexaceae bacterium]
ALTALPVLLLCGATLLDTPVIRPDTTIEITASGVEVSRLESGRAGISLPGTTAVLFVHEDHNTDFLHNALKTAPPELPITVRVYKTDRERLDRPGRVQALEVRSPERVYLSLKKVAAGRNAAEPLLLVCTLVTLVILGGEVVNVLRSLARRPA